MIGFLKFFTIERQFILFVVSFIGIFLMHAWAGFAGSWFPALIVIFLVTKHLLIGTVNAAAMKMQYGDFDGAEKVLKYTVKPDWLRFTYHGMYYWIKSTIEFRKKNFVEAERFSDIALGLDLHDDFKAMIYLQLMNIYGTKNNKIKVKELYDKARKLRITQELVRNNIDEVGLMLEGKHEAQKQMMGKKVQRSMMSSSYMRRNTKKK